MPPPTDSGLFRLLDGDLQQIAKGLGNLAAAFQKANQVPWVSPPTHNTSSGIAGQVAYDGSYLYVCIGVNSWARVAIGGSW